MNHKPVGFCAECGHTIGLHYGPEGVCVADCRSLTPLVQCGCKQFVARSSDTPRVESDIPRRARMDQWTATERLIHVAVMAVEEMPADLRLTRAVILLGEARDAVADFVDGVVRMPAPSNNVEQLIAQARVNSPSVDEAYLMTREHLDKIIAAVRNEFI